MFVISNTTVIDRRIMIAESVKKLDIGEIMNCCISDISINFEKKICMTVDTFNLLYEVAWMIRSISMGESGQIFTIEGLVVDFNADGEGGDLIVYLDSKLIHMVNIKRSLLFLKMIELFYSIGRQIQEKGINIELVFENLSLFWKESALMTNEKK